MMIFTMVWIAQTNNPVAAYWTASYYRDIIGGERIERVEEEKEGFIPWLQTSVWFLLHGGGASTIPVGKVCVLEYNS